MCATITPPNDILDMFYLDLFGSSGRGVYCLAGGSCSTALSSESFVVVLLHVILLCGDITA